MLYSPLRLLPLSLLLLPATAQAADQSHWEQLRLYTPLLAVLVPLVAYLTAQYKDWRSAQGTLNQAFRGDDDAIVYLTHKVQHNEWRRRMKRAPGFRREVLTALCLAWSVKSADYVRAHIFDALLCAKKQGYGAEALLVLDKMLGQYAQYNQRFGSADFAALLTSLEQLRRELAADTGGQ